MDNSFVIMSAVSACLFNPNLLFLFPSSAHHNIFSRHGAIYNKLFAYIFLLTFQWVEPDGIGPWHGWLTIVPQRSDTAGWVIWPLKLCQHKFQ